MNLYNIPLEQIIVEPNRFRDATGDMEGLATSILKHGVLEPIIVEERADSLIYLIAGYRRLTACKMNVMETVPAIMKSDLTPLQRKEIELEENIMREQMSTAERVKAIAQLDAIKRETNPNWTQDQTAAVAGLPRQADVSTAVHLAKMMQLFPELADAKSVNQMKQWADKKVGQIQRIMEVQAHPENFASIEERIWLGDSTELIKTVPDESFHLILTDPPFGVNYDKRTAGSADSAANSYKDSGDLYERILGMAPEMYRTLRSTGFVVFFYGMSWHDRVQHAFASAGFAVDYAPIIWDRSDGRTFTTRPDHFFTRGYDVALFARKGDAKIAVQNKPNILRIPPVEGADREALVERPVELYAELIRRLTIKGERVADFFVGSGSCPAAAASLGRDFFGIELSPERRALALKKISAHTPT